MQGKRPKPQVQISFFLLKIDFIFIQYNRSGEGDSNSYLPVKINGFITVK